jgi:hypothetical protein
VDRSWDTFDQRTVLLLSVPTKKGHTSVFFLNCPDFVGTKYDMASESKRRGRPPKGSDKIKGAYLEVRLEEVEKQAFREAAELAGLDLSAWARERLRKASRSELEGAGRAVAFLEKRSGRK